MSAPDSCAYPVGTRVRIGTHHGTVHPAQPRVTVQIDGGEIAEVPALCVHPVGRQAPIVDEANSALQELAAENQRLATEVDWLSEACRLTVADASIARDQRGRLHRDAVTARAKLIELIGGDWTVEPSLTELATFAARFWGDDRKELEQLRSGVVRLSAEASFGTIPDDAEAQFAAVLHAAGSVDPCPGHCQAEASALLDLVRGWLQTPEPAGEARGSQANPDLDQDEDVSP